MRATLYRLLLGYIDQVTTSLLHQLGGYPMEATSKVRSARQSKSRFLMSHSKVHSVRQLKVDSGRTFACFGGILRV
jgi:hypothetical protein